MNKAVPLILAVASLSAAVSAQTGPRTMDNFDRSQGVQVVYSAAPARISEASAANKNDKNKAGTGSKLKRTSASRAIASASDGLAARDGHIPGRHSISMGSGSSLKGFTTGNPLHDGYILESSRRYNIDPLLIYAQMHQESAFKINATSHKGASGLMQLMPATARRFGVTKIYDPKQNIEAGVKYMRWLLDTFNGDVVLALAGYNAGEGAVMRYGHNVPPFRETREYVRRIADRYSSISDPRSLHSARTINPQSTARLDAQETRPLSIYEPNAVPVRLADGRMMLMNQ